jgi:hypothetical protein
VTLNRFSPSGTEAAKKLRAIPALLQYVFMAWNVIVERRHRLHVMVLI